MMLIAPDARAGVVVLSNSDASGASGLAPELLRIVLGLPVREHKEIAVDPKLYVGYIGRYEMSPFVVNIVWKNDHLFAQIRGQNYQIFPENVRDYFFKIFDAQITFVTDANGRAKELIWHEGGTDAYLHRIE